MTLRLLAVFSCLAAGALQGGDNQRFERLSDIVYAEVNGSQLLLNIYLPRSRTERPPLVVYVHGGAWRAGRKERMPLKGLPQEGFAVASVGYRLSPVARFPAQIHDIKAAVRFLRAKQDEYGYDARWIAIAGSSAGAHLAALAGVTNGSVELEGEVGGHLDESSDLQAIVSFYGASNLLTILEQSTPRGLGVRVPALQLLLGAQPEDLPELAKLASPVFHVDDKDPALLLLHGDQDLQMPINQSHELQGKYEERGLPVQLEVIHGAAHGGQSFYDGPRTRVVAGFLEKHLQ